jgi:hypothetical protein
MKVQEIMERAGIRRTGTAIAYIKDALEEINMLSETHIARDRININENQRFYQIPNSSVRITDIRCKNHNNNDNIYKSIPRMIYQPDITDADGE